MIDLYVSVEEHAIFDGCHADHLLDAALEGTDVLQTALLGNGSNAVLGLVAQQTHRQQCAQVVEIGIRRSVDAAVTEQTDEPLMADTKEFGEGLRVEVGLRQDIILLYTDFEEGHQLTVVLQVGIALTLDVLRQYLTGYLRTAAQFYVFLQPLGEVEVYFSICPGIRRMDLPMRFSLHSESTVV